MGPNRPSRVPDKGVNVAQIEAIETGAGVLPMASRAYAFCPSHLTAQAAQVV